MQKHDPNDIIERISVVRIENNMLWMELLRLAFKHAPDEARKIVKEIAKNDKEISKWCKRL